MTSEDPKLNEGLQNQNVRENWGNKVGHRCLLGWKGDGVTGSSLGVDDGWVAGD